MIDFADFVVTSPDDRPQLIVEAKRYRDTSPGWAAEFRRNMFAHGPVPPARFFLLASPDHFYLWKDAPVAEPVSPYFTIDARAELAPYLSTLHADVGELSGEGFEFLVRAWLNDLLAAGPDADRDDPAVRRARKQWLVDSGLWDAVRTGQIREPALRGR